VTGAGWLGPASSFLGRGRELATLDSLLGQRWLVSLVGPGGCGKTRLAAEWIRAHPNELVGFVELSALPDAALLAVTVLSACGIREEPGADPLERAADCLAQKRGVLVLDTCEHLRAPVAAMVVRLLRGRSGLRVVVTSRVSLGIVGETVLPVAGLADEAQALFLDRARWVQPELVVDEERIRAICELADGLPLAIELAAAHARALCLADIQSGMAYRLGFLTGSQPVGEPRHRSMEASIGWSYRLLDPSAQRALRALSVLPGRFSLEAAVAVVGERGRELVEALVDYSLVVFSPADGRYVLLDTIREFAARESVTAGDAGATGRRVVKWVAGLAASVAPGLDRADAAVLRRVARDDSAVRAALGYATSTGDGLEDAVEIVVALAFYWFLRGHSAEGWQWAERVMAVWDLPSSGLSWASAFLAAYAGDLAAATEQGERAVTVAAAAGDDRFLGRALIVVAMGAMFDNPGSAQAGLRKAVEHTDRAGDGWGSVEARQALAYTFLWQSNHRAALMHLDAAMPALDELRHDQLQAWDGAGRADVARLAGRFDRAVTEGRRGLELACAVGEPVSAAFALRPLVFALCQLGRAGEAVTEIAARRTFFTDHPGLSSNELVADAAAIATFWASGAAAALPQLDALHMTGAGLGWTSFSAEVGSLRAVSRLAAGDASGARVVATETVELAQRCEAREAGCVAALAGCAADRLLGGEANTGLGDTDARVHQQLADAAAFGLLPLVADALDLIAALAIDKGRAAFAARLHAASGRLRDELGCVLSPLAALFRGSDELEVAQRLDPEEVAAAHREGRQLSTTQAVAYAARSRGRRARPSSGWASLTPTELEVVTLATAGLGNRAIGEQLLIGEGTVRTHLRHVFAKLGVCTRAELAAAAARRGI
jgi:predicted ATPase/DNA-binding CsgD family transcriptional regulator